MKDKRPKRILIVLLGAIGDVTRALPLAVRIKRCWPETTVCWAVDTRSRLLLEDHPAVDELIVFQRSKGVLAYLRFLWKLKKKRFDVVLDLQRLFKTGIATRLAGAPRRIGFHRDNSKELNWLFCSEYIKPVERFSPKIDHYQLFGDLLGLEPMRPLSFGLEAQTKSVERIEELLLARSGNGGPPPPEKRAALILGSTWPSRLWTILHYRRLIQRLYDQFGLTSVFVGGDSEIRFAKQILHTADKLPVINLVGTTSLRDLFAMFSRSRLAIGSDSGPMHIASAANIPVISLWGSTSPERSAPIGSEHLVLQSVVGCSPCYRPNCPGLDNLCMSDIPSDTVLELVESVLAEDKEIEKTL